MKKLLVLLLFSLLVFHLPAVRKALIIGNSDYGSQERNLNNPVNDATLLESTLKKYSFSVSKTINVNKRGFRDAVENFAEGLQSDDEVIFYFSGHGAQVNGRNYLLPSGCDIRREDDCDIEAVSANWILGLLSDAKTVIFILDACRNNPYIKKTKGDAVKGLAPMRTQSDKNQMIIYATEDGTEARDGEGKNSPFVQALVSNIEKSDKKLQDMLLDIKIEVIEATHKEQIPTAYGIMSDFYFKPRKVQTPRMEIENAVKRNPDTFSSGGGSNAPNPNYPKAVGWVNDFSGVLSEAKITEMTNWITKLKEKTDVEIAVVTVKELHGIDCRVFANELYKTWGVGNEQDEGVMLLITTTERELKFEVGYGLESVLTDQVTQNIYYKMKTTLMDSKDYNKAIEDAVVAMIIRICSSRNINPSAVIYK